MRQRNYFLFVLGASIAGDGAMLHPLSVASGSIRNGRGVRGLRKSLSTGVLR
jgi:hypothetical protein